MSQLFAEENILLKIIFNVTIDTNNEFTKGGVFLPGLRQDIQS